ncbi:MAG: NUDIX domain-containing protein [Bacillota bacterium]
MGLSEKTVSKEMVYKGRILNLRVDDVELPNGKTVKREVVEHGGAVAVVPLDEKNNLLMVRQYRYPVGKVLLEVPAGMIEEMEEPHVCAARELAEETGCEARELKLLFSFYSTPGFTTEKLHIFLARGLKCLENHPDEDEFIEVSRVPLEKALDMIDRGEICDAKTIIGILAAKREMDR